MNETPTAEEITGSRLAHENAYLSLALRFIAEMRPGNPEHMRELATVALEALKREEVAATQPDEPPTKEGECVCICGCTRRTATQLLCPVCRESWYRQRGYEGNHGVK